MKRKQLLQLAAILLVLALGALIRQIWPTAARPAGEEMAALNPGLDPGLVTGIEFGKGTGPASVVLARDDGRWHIPAFSNARADEKKVAQFLKSLRSARGELRGRDKNLFGDFRIGDDEAFYARLSAAPGKPLLNLLIGAVQPEVGSVFVRLKDSADVYLTDADLLSDMGVGYEDKEGPPQKERWLSLNFFPADAKEIRGLEVQRFENGQGTPVCSVARQDGAWRYVREKLPFAIDPAKVEKFLDRLAGAEARKVLDTAGQAETSEFRPAKTGTSSPRERAEIAGPLLWQMKIGLEGGREIVLQVFSPKGKEDGVWLKVPGESVLFELAPYTFEAMDADDGAFFRDNPLGIDAAKIKRISVFAEMQLKTVYPAQGDWDGLKKYMEALKNFRVQKLLIRSDWVKKLGLISRCWLEILNQDGSQVRLEIGDAVSKPDEPKVYEALLRGSDELFTVSQETFEALFTGLDAKLTAPAGQKKLPDAAP